MKILQAATYAPSAKNRQNWHFVVIEDEDKIRKCLFTNSPIQNVSAAMENLMLRENNTTKKKVTSGSSYIFIKIYFI